MARDDARMTETDTDPTTVTPQLSTDPRPAFRRAVDQLVDVAAGVRTDQLGEPTPCTGMDVRALLDHLAMALGRTEAVARRLPLEEWPGPETSAGDDWAAHLRQAGDAAAEVWQDDALLATVMQLPWDTLAGIDVLGIYTNEVVVHTWDLAQATGQSPAWDDVAVAVADEAIRQQLPDADRGPMWDQAKQQLPPGIPWDDPFANAVPVADDAPAIDRLVAWNGRLP